MDAEKIAKEVKAGKKEKEALTEFLKIYNSLRRKTAEIQRDENRLAELIKEYFKDLKSLNIPKANKVYHVAEKQIPKLDDAEKELLNAATKVFQAAKGVEKEIEERLKGIQDLRQEFLRIQDEMSQTAQWIHGKRTLTKNLLEHMKIAILKANQKGEVDLEELKRDLAYVMPVKADPGLSQELERIKKGIRKSA